MSQASHRRVSQTEMKSAEGFRAQLSGVELSMLVQLLCGRRERMVARVTSYGEEGLLFSVAGRIVHATLGELVGEEAVLRMLRWHSGDLVLCDLPFPARATVQRSLEGLLLLAAKYEDDCALDEVLLAPSPPPLRSSALPPPPVSFGTPLPSRGTAPQAPGDASRTRSRPPPPPPNALRPVVLGEPMLDAALVASVRMSPAGACSSSFGSSDDLAQLVAYVSHLLGLIQSDFALDAFEALHVELADQRLLIFGDAGDTMALLMSAGSAAQALRLRLGL